MKTKTLPLLATALLLSAAASAQLQRIVLHGSSAPQVYTDLAAAVAAAQSGDRLYLSGGNFTVTGDLVLDKTLHFIGAGVNPDSTNVTGLTAIAPTGSTQVLTAALNSTFTGIRFINVMQFGNGTTDYSPTNVVFQRCEFMSYTHLNAGSTSTFDECVFRHRFYGYGGSAVVTRCLFPFAGNATHGTISGFSTGGLFLSNCVVLGGRLNGCDYSTARNCIFTGTGAPFYQSNGMTIVNNLIVSASLVGNMSGYTESGNILGADIATIFVNPASDWHLLPGSPAIGMANDGNDAGLYGTHSPYKPGNVPYNPHYSQAAIAPSTDWNGALPVQIRTAAQTH
ncbi:MAG: hypothetical protein IPM12_05690 [Flavobacteriales bacterium]|nr:hypothetical protein [Flavobacteriales bacterium]